jgi:hypothetical protein
MLRVLGDVIESSDVHLEFIPSSELSEANTHCAELIAPNVGRKLHCLLAAKEFKRGVRQLLA